MKSILRAQVICVSILILMNFASAQASEPVQEPVSNLQSVLRQAYLTNPSLKAAREQLRATQEKLPQALSGWKPTVKSDLGVTYTNVEGNTLGDGSTQKDMGVSLEQPIYRGGSTVAEVSSARRTIEAQSAILQSAEQDILLQAVAAYADVYKNQTVLDVAEKNKEITARELKATQDRFNAGELTKTDVSQAEARLAQADSEIVTARGQLNSSKAAFVKVAGFMPQTLETPDLEVQIPNTLDAAIDQGQQTSPLVLFAVHAHEASQSDVDDIFGELLPEVSLAGNVSKSYDPSPGLEDQTNKSIGVLASIPLYEAGATRSRVREAKHTANKRYLEIHEARRAAEENVVSSWSDWEAAKGEILSRRSQLQALQVAQEGVKAEAEFGSRTVLDVLDANEEVYDAEVSLAQAQRNALVSQFRLLASMGVLDPDVLGFGADTVNPNSELQAQANKIFDIHVDSVQED